MKFLFTDASAAKKRSTSQGVTPASRTRTTAITKASPLQKPVKEPNSKKKTEIKKENSYDASDSDSEHGSVDRLNNDGDFGYETGSLDGSDVSTGELLSPSAKDEHKTILTSDQSGSTAYSYAEVEFRPLLVTNEGGVATRNPEKFGSGEEDVLLVDKNAISDRKSYTYAGDEFRPLIVTEEGGVAAPVEAKKSSKNTEDENGNGDKRGSGGRKMLMEYEEVQIIDGGYDRANIKVTSANQRNRAETDDLHALGPLNDVYAVVQKKPKETDSNDNAVQKQNSAIQRPIVELGDVAPSIPGGRKDSSMYEAITGELQNMIMACDEVSLDEKSARTNSNERKGSSGDKKFPPPIPKPYAGPGLNASVAKEPMTKEASGNSERGVFNYFRKLLTQGSAVIKPKPQQGTHMLVHVKNMWLVARHGCKICIKMLSLALKIYIKMDVSVVATTFFSLRMLMKTASRML